MNKILLFSATIWAHSFAFASIPEGKYTLDSVHSKVGFSVPHLVISSVEGRFNKYEGHLKIGKNISDSSIEAKIDVASIDTANKDRDDHLRNQDFFETSKFPQMIFKSKKITLKDKALTVEGDLTLKNNTKPVTLKGTYLGTMKDAMGNEKIAFNLTTQIQRKDFGITWNKVVEAAPAIGDEVTIDLKMQATKEKK